MTILSTQLALYDSPRLGCLAQWLPVAASGIERTTRPIAVGLASDRSDSRSAQADGPRPVAGLKLRTCGDVIQPEKLQRRSGLINV